QAEDGIRDFHVTGVQTCALPILEPLVSLGYIVNTAGKRSERWVLASSLDASLDPLTDCFLFDSKVIEIGHDPALRQVIARLLTEDNTVKLRDILYLTQADPAPAATPVANTDSGHNGDTGTTTSMPSGATNTTVAPR